MSERKRVARRAKAIGVLTVGLAVAGCSSMGLDGSTTGRSSGAQDRVLLETLSQMARDSEARTRYPQAVDQYSRLVEAAPENEEYVLGLARNLRYTGRPQEALRQVRRALSEDRISESLDVRIELARALAATGAHSDAAALVADMRTQAPDDPRILALAGILADRDGRHQAAQEAYRAVLAANPDDLRTANNLALSLALSGDLEEAIRLQTETARHPAATLQMRQNLAVLYAFAGRMDMAERVTRAILPEAQADRVLRDLAQMVGRGEAVPPPDVLGGDPPRP